jgi:hypothetical protein
LGKGYSVSGWDLWSDNFSGTLAYSKLDRHRRLS